MNLVEAGNDPALRGCVVPDRNQATEKPTPKRRSAISEKRGASPVRQRSPSWLSPLAIAGVLPVLGGAGNASHRHLDCDRDIFYSEPRHRVGLLGLFGEGLTTMLWCVVPLVGV